MKTICCRRAKKSARAAVVKDDDSIMGVGYPSRWFGVFIFGAVIEELSTYINALGAYYYNGV